MAEPGIPLALATLFVALLVVGLVILVRGLQLRSSPRCPQCRGQITILRNKNEETSKAAAATGGFVSKIPMGGGLPGKLAGALLGLTAATVVEAGGAALRAKKPIATCKACGAEFSERDAKVVYGQGEPAAGAFLAIFSIVALIFFVLLPLGYSY